MPFTDNLKVARMEMGLTQKDAAAKMDVKLHNLTAYEEGRSQPNIDKLKNIVDYYNVPHECLYDFLFGKYDPV